MSEISKIKSATDQLTFLNGEIGKAKESLDFFIAEGLETEQGNKESLALFQAEQKKRLEKLSILDGNILKKEEKITEIGRAIDDADYLLGVKIEELKKHDEKMTQDESTLERMTKSLTARQEEVVSQEKELAKKKDDISERENAIVAKEKSVALAQASVDEMDLKVRADKDEVVRLRNQLEKDVEKNSEKEKNYDDRVNFLDEKERRLKSEQFVLEDSRHQLDLQEKDIARRETVVTNAEQELVFKQDAINKRDEVSIKKETDVSLREAECRIREKRINIALQEQQLNQSNVVPSTAN